MSKIREIGQKALTGFLLGALITFLVVAGLGIGWSIFYTVRGYSATEKQGYTGGVCYDFTEPNILTHHHGRGEKTVYRKVE